jgi:WD40 repeat protein
MLWSVHASGHKNSLSFSIDGNRVLSGGWDGQLHVLDVSDGRTLHSHLLANKHILDIDLLPDGTRVLVGCDEGDVLILDQQMGNIVQVLQSHGRPADSVACSHDARLVAAGMIGGVARIWDVESGKLLHTLHHGDNVRGIQFSPDGRVLVTSGADNLIRIWDVATGAERAILSGHSHWVPSVVFSPDGQVLASAGEDRTVRIWRAPVPARLP